MIQSHALLDSRMDVSISAGFFCGDTQLVTAQLAYQRMQVTADV